MAIAEELRLVPEEDHDSLLSEQDEDEEDEEEDVSLCDLPVNLIKDQCQTQSSTTKADEAQVITEAQEDQFEFGSSMRGGSNFLPESEMCAADELFFQGQILPLRLSVSSESKIHNPTRFCLSMDHRHGPLGGGGFRSNSYSSSSRISLNYSSSRSSSSSSSTTTTTTMNASKPIRVRNQFYTEPSPKPQIKISNVRSEKVGSRHQKQRSSMWDIFRLGLVRTPDIELSSSRATNNKNCVSRNSSVNSNTSTNLSTTNNNNNNSSSSNNNNNASTTTTSAGVKSSKQGEQSKLQRRQRLFHGCKCSFETVDSINAVVSRRSTSSSMSDQINDLAAQGMKVEHYNKVEVELKMKKNNKKKQMMMKQKQAMSHHRTYEWLKELSHANSPCPPPPMHVV